MSPKAAGLAAKMGFTNIKVMLKGAPGWKKLGHMLVASNDFVNKGNVVIIDLRPAKDCRSGHIPKAVNIPIANLEGAKDDFPIMKSQVPIILYGTVAQVQSAAKMIKSWGYKIISGVEGGFAGWQAAGNPVDSGEPANEIAWKYIPGKGEVGIDEFKKVVAGNLANKVILDVRGPEEMAAGMFDNAINVPLDEIEKRMGELPKDKELLCYCATGARAEMTARALKKAGYKARFLIANIECEDGECEIEE